MSSCPTTPTGMILGIVASGVVFGASSLSAQCPPESELLQKIAEIEGDLELASRSSRFGASTPIELYRRAARTPGESFAERNGIEGHGVLVGELDIERLWRAINDEDHHALRDDFVPVEHSEVIAGEPRGRSRILFQWFQRMGVGRWWVSRIEINSQLYRESGGRLWEVFWEDVLEETDTTAEPIAAIASEMRALNSSQGSWLLSELAPGCTAIEYFTRTRPGGVVKLGQLLFAKKAVRDALDGIVRLTVDHLPEHENDDFAGPDGEPMP